MEPKIVSTQMVEFVLGVSLAMKTLMEDVSMPPSDKAAIVLIAVTMDSSKMVSVETL